MKYLKDNFNTICVGICTLCCLYLSVQVRHTNDILNWFETFYLKDALGNFQDADDTLNSIEEAVWTIYREMPRADQFKKD